MACALTIEVVTDPDVSLLTRRAFKAMELAGLDAPIDHLATFIESSPQRGPARKFVEAKCVGQRLYVQLKPFAELALREAIDISTNRSLDCATKERRLIEMFTLAGLE